MGRSMLKSNPFKNVEKSKCHKSRNEIAIDKSATFYDDFMTDPNRPTVCVLDRFNLTEQLQEDLFNCLPMSVRTKNVPCSIFGENSNNNLFSFFQTMWWKHKLLSFASQKCTLNIHHKYLRAATPKCQHPVWFGAYNSPFVFHPLSLTFSRVALTHEHIHDSRTKIRW